MGSPVNLRRLILVIVLISLAGKTLAEARIPQRTGLVVLALRPHGEGGAYRYNPGPESRLEPGDVMIVLGDTEQLQSLRAYVKG